MRILLVDDEPLALQRLQLALAAVPDTEVVGTAADGPEAIEKIAALRPDLVMLDVLMPGQSGVDVAAALADAAWRPDVVFVTAFDHFAIEAFAVDAIDYLLKPVTFDRLHMAIERVRRRQALSEKQSVAEQEVVNGFRENAFDDPDQGPGYCAGIWVPFSKGSVRVPVDTIDRIEAARDYVLLNTPIKSYILRAKMNELEQRLDPALMMRIHRSHIVRIDAVVGLEKPGKGTMRLVLSDGANLQVGPNYQEQVVDRLGQRDWLTK
jgi:DNA-binding LytR/AlgR family response regulator